MKLYNFAEAAEELRVEESWLRRHSTKLPRSKKGRVVTFTEDDLRRIEERFHLEPTTGPFAVPVSAPASAGPHPLAQLRPLPARGSAARIA